MIDLNTASTATAHLGRCARDAARTAAKIDWALSDMWYRSTILSMGEVKNA